MLEDSEFKPFNLTDFTVVETLPDDSESLSATQEDGQDGAEVEESEISVRLASFKPLIIDEQGSSEEFDAEGSTDLADRRTDAEKIQLSQDFRTANFFQENSLLTNAENFAETIRDGAKLDKTQLLTKIEEQATDTKRIHKKTVAENQEAEEERKKLLSATEEKVDEIKNEAFNEGFEAGRLKGMQKRYDEAEPLVLQVNSVMEQLNSLRQAVRFQAEKELVELALQIAKKVVAEEIKLPNDVIKNIVKAALHETEVQGKIYLYLHPDDYEFLLKSKADLEHYLNEEQTLVLRQNPELKPGSIYVESDEEIISRSIEDQFDKLEETLTEQIENRHAQLSEVDLDAHDFSIQTSSDDAANADSAAVHLQDVGEVDSPAETDEKAELKKADPEKSTVKDTEEIVQKTMPVDSSEVDDNEKPVTQSGSVDLRKMDETDLSEDAADPALETKSIETEEQEQQTKPVEIKEPELETQVAKTEESVPETETDKSAELDPPK